jgi:phosphonate transport system permease protein
MPVGAAPVREYPEPRFVWLSARHVRVGLVLVAVIAFYVVSWQLAKVNLAKLADGLPRMATWATKAWPPATDELPVLLRRAAETVAMAAIGTTVAAILALPVCILAARNVTPSMALYYPTRWFLNGPAARFTRVRPASAAGLGPFAGCWARAHTRGSTAALGRCQKIPSGALEAAYRGLPSRCPGPLRARRAPSMVSVALFWWEPNVRPHRAGSGGAGGTARS